MTAPPSPAARRGRILKNIALTSLLSGFALELGGAVAGNWTVFKAGIFLFLMGIPLFFLGWMLGRRKA